MDTNSLLCAKCKQHFASRDVLKLSRCSHYVCWICFESELYSYYYTCPSCFNSHRVAMNDREFAKSESLRMKEELEMSHRNTRASTSDDASFAGGKPKRTRTLDARANKGSNLQHGNYEEHVDMKQEGINYCFNDSEQAEFFCPTCVKSLCANCMKIPKVRCSHEYISPDDIVSYIKGKNDKVKMEYSKLETVFRSWKKIMSSLDADYKCRKQKISDFDKSIFYLERDTKRKKNDDCFEKIKETLTFLHEMERDDGISILEKYKNGIIIQDSYDELLVGSISASSSDSNLQLVKISTDSSEPVQYHTSEERNHVARNNFESSTMQPFETRLSEDDKNFLMEEFVKISTKLDMKDSPYVSQSKSCQELEEQLEDEVSGHSKTKTELDKKQQMIKELMGELQKKENLIKELVENLETQGTEIANLKSSLKSVSSEIKNQSNNTVPHFGGPKSQTLNPLHQRSNLRANLSKTIGGPNATKQLEQATPRRQQKIKVECVIPAPLYTDERLKAVLSELQSELQLQLRSDHGQFEVNIDKRESSLISRRDWVLIPCINSSRIGSDVSVALNTAKLEDQTSVILLIYNHLAPHNCQIATPTHERLRNPGSTVQCRAIIDLVFWQGHMYKCEVNRTGCIELLTIITPNVGDIHTTFH